MPINKITGERIDLALNPLGIYGRMNFGQLIEGLIAKVIKKCQKEIIKNKNNIPEVLDKLSILAEYINDEEYSNKIKNLNENIRDDDNLLDTFYDDVYNNGLFFEAPCFASFDITELNEKIEKLFDIKVMDDLIVKKELFEYFKDIINNDELITPEEDVTYTEIFNCPIYTNKLLNLVEKAIMSRDLGNYNITNKQPIRGNGFNHDQGSRIGNMEVDALIAHNAINSLREINTIKSDSTEKKANMIIEILSKDDYYMSGKTQMTYTKTLIESLMKFLNN